MDPNQKTVSSSLYKPLGNDGEDRHEKEQGFPGGQPRALTYSRQAQGFQPQTPAYPQQAPGYPPQALSYPAQASGFQPQVPGYPAKAPGYPQQAPGYPPQALSYPAQAPGFQPQVPGYPAKAPGYPQQDAGFQPQAPGYPQQVPAYKPHIPGSHPQSRGGQLNDFTEVHVDQPGLLIQPGEDDTFGPSFGNKSIRAAFVRKVYTILTLQLLVTIGIIALFIFHEGVKFYVTHSFPMYISAYVVFLTTYITLTCCTGIRRQHPYNLILLVVFTLSMAYMAGVISAFYDVAVVFMAMGITGAVCLGISFFAIQTKWDVTGYGLYLFVASWIILIFGIISIFVAIYVGSMIMNLVYSGLVALLFSMYLVYDTQQIVGGRKIELSPEEYIYGALQLYVDIMEIFLAILRLVGRK